MGKIDNENFITGCTFDDGRYDFYDYCVDITDDERSYAIDSLAKYLLHTGMFLDENEKDTVIYNGGADEWKEDTFPLL